MLFNRQKRVWGTYGPYLNFIFDPSGKLDLLKRIKEEERILSGLEINRDLIKKLESILLIITFPFFFIWVVILMPVIVILWIAVKFDKERKTL